MTGTLLHRIVLPVASVEDAETTCERVLPRLEDDGAVLAVHVVEKAGGAPDKASVEQREEYAGDCFAAVEEAFAGAGIDLETEIRYGTNVAEAILAAADEFDASAVVFTPRGGSRWAKLLTGDTARSLIDDADRPVVVLPAADGEGGDSPNEGENDERDPPNEQEGDG